MARPYKTEDIVGALNRSNGYVYLAADLLGCTADTIYRRAKRSKVVRDAMDRPRGRGLDRAESKLDDAIDRGEPWAISFKLATIGKHRGYVKRDEITGKDGESLELRIIERIRRADD